MSVAEGGVVEVGDTFNDWRWEHFEGEIWNLVLSWGSIFKYFYFVSNVSRGYGDVWSGGK